MFIQVIQGQVSDREELRDAFDLWLREVAPGAEGWLGTTAGVTDQGDLITLARFESAEAAQRNSHRPEQHQWWMDTSKLLIGGAVFHDCHDTEVLGAGGSDDAGFVQVMRGRTRDMVRMRELNRQLWMGMADIRPDILGGILAPHDDGTTFTEAVYFTSEAEARLGEQMQATPELRPQFDEMQQLVSDLRYYDLTEPWLSSPIR
jgi:hypothetical protein